MNKKYKYLIVVLLILASFIALGRIVGNDFTNFDDDFLITENNNIKAGFNAESIKWAFTTAYFSYWQPLTWLSIMLDWSLFGANASGHHLVSLLWHIGSVILLFLFLSKTTGSLWPSAFVAAIFALHPLRVESVAWAAERKDVLSVFFGLATIYAYACYAETPKLSKYLLCLLLFSLALMSKPMMITLPCVILLVDYWPLRRWQKPLTADSVPVLVDKSDSKKKSKKIKVESSVNKKIAKPVQSGRQLIGNLLWEKVPFFALALALSIGLIWQLQEDRYMAPLQQIPLSERFLNAIVSYVSYLEKIFWPVDLAVFYPYQYSYPIWQVAGSSVLLLGISAAVIYLARRTPFLPVGWLWFVGVLFPVIGLMQAGDQAMTDRYTYFPSIGIAIMVIWGISSLLHKVKPREIIIIPAAIILAALTFLTWQQCGYWKNSVSLFTHVVQATKDNYVAHIHLGAALAAEGKYDEAIGQYFAAIKINPDRYTAYHFLAIVLERQGKFEEAIANYLIAIKVNPGNADIHYNLAVLLERQGKFEEAIAHYREALHIKPDYSSAHVNLGTLLGKQLKHNEALYHFQQALRIDPNDPGIYFSMGVALANTGKLKEAIAHFRQAIYLKPEYEDARRALRMTMELEKRQQR